MASIKSLATLCHYKTSGMCVVETMESMTVPVKLQSDEKNSNGIILSESVVLGYIRRKEHQIEGHFEKSVEINHNILPVIFGWSKKQYMKSIAGLVSKGIILQIGENSTKCGRYAINRKARVNTYGYIKHVPVKFLRERRYGGIGFENGYALFGILQLCFEIENTNLGCFEAAMDQFYSVEEPVIRGAISRLHSMGLINSNICYNKEFVLEKQLRINKFEVEEYIKQLNRFLSYIGLFKEITITDIEKKATVFRREEGFENKK